MQLEVPQWAMVVVFVCGLLTLLLSVGLMGTYLWRAHSGQQFIVSIDGEKRRVRRRHVTSTAALTHDDADDEGDEGDEGGGWDEAVHHYRAALQLQDDGSDNDSDNDDVAIDVAESAPLRK